MWLIRDQSHPGHQGSPWWTPYCSEAAATCTEPQHAPPSLPLTLQDVAAPTAAHDAHACSVAMTMSTPNVLAGDADDNTSSGVAVTFAVAGNVTSCENSDAVTLAEDDALHTSATGAAGAGATHDPAVAAVVEGSDKHVHDAQPSACTAEGEQQQPPLHKLDWQS